MALNSFTTGAFVAAPIAAALTWLAVTWQQHVDVRVERDTVAVRADRAAFDAGFNRDWDAATGKPRPVCDPAATAELARLRERLTGLEDKLTGSRADLEAEVRDLGRMVQEQPQ
jgi:hypothetical protein